MTKPTHPVTRFEEQTFRAAHQFVVAVFKPFGRTERKTYSVYPEAVAAAEALDLVPDGRPALIYAVTPLGRATPIGKSERQKYLAIWREMRSG